jgi:hypothetical protein
MPDVRLSRRQLNRATLARQMLLQRAKVTPVAAVERLAGMQAQVPRPPFVGLWSRIEGFEREDLVRAVERRQVVRATLMRVTLHLVSRRDFLEFRAALQPMLSRATLAVLGDRMKTLDVEALVAAARAYFDEEPRTFAELRKHLGPHFTGRDERALGYIVRTHLPLVQTPSAGQPWAYPAVADFALAETWLGERPREEDGSRALALRYFAAFGPATAQDFQTWSGLPTARAVVEQLRPKLRAFRDERGRELLDVVKGPRPSEDEPAPVRFLPEFDNLLLAYADRTRIIANEHRPAVTTKNLLVPATFLVDGFCAGTWKVEAKAQTARLSIKPFGTLTRTTRSALAAEGERLLQFMHPGTEKRSVDFV